MIAKLTAKNQLTLPKAAVEAVGDVEYFGIEIRAGQLILTPVRMQRADAVRAKLAELNLTDSDIDAAVAWARKRAPRDKVPEVAEERASYNAKSPAKKKLPRS
jgi:hypothetical protein